MHNYIFYCFIVVEYKCIQKNNWSNLTSLQQRLLVAAARSGCEFLMHIILWLTHVIILYTKHDFAVWSYMYGPSNNSIYILFPLMHGPLNPTYVFYFCFMMKEHPHIFHFIFLNKYIFHFTMRKKLWFDPSWLSPIAQDIRHYFFVILWYYSVRFIFRCIHIKYIYIRWDDLTF